MNCNQCKRFISCKRASSEVCKNFKEATPITYVTPEEYADRFNGRVVTETVTEVQTGEEVKEFINRKFPVVISAHYRESVFSYIKCSKCTFPIFGDNEEPSKEWYGEIISKDYSEKLDPMMAISGVM